MFGEALAGTMGVTTEGRTEQASFLAVSGNFLSALTLRPVLGRLILPGEGETPGTRAVLVLGYAYWQKRFSGDPTIVGKVVRINGKPVDIVGILPKEFHGPFAAFEMDGYVPLSTVFSGGPGINFWNDRNKRLILAMGRLKPGVTITKAQSLFDV